MPPLHPHPAAQARPGAGQHHCGAHGVLCPTPCPRCPQRVAVAACLQLALPGAGLPGSISDPNLVTEANGRAVLRVVGGVSTCSLGGAWPGASARGRPASRPGLGSSVGSSLGKCVLCRLALPLLGASRADSLPRSLAPQAPDSLREGGEWAGGRGHPPCPGPLGGSRLECLSTKDQLLSGKVRVPSDTSRRLSFLRGNCLTAIISGDCAAWVLSETPSPARNSAPAPRGLGRMLLADTSPAQGGEGPRCQGNGLPLPPGRWAPPQAGWGVRRGRSRAGSEDRPPWASHPGD